MATFHFKGSPVNTVGQLPQIGQTFKFENLIQADLAEVASATYAGQTKVLNIFPSIDTGVCATSVRTFNKQASDLNNTVVINVSADLPFALGRFCGAEGITNCVSTSTFRSSFGKNSGLEISESVLKGLLARAVIVLDGQDKVKYVELVNELTTEPNYTAALTAARS